MRQALYRLYRPRHFDEVVGQEHITTVLKSEMAQGRPTHAYLFVGSRGTGKTTCAKLVAKAVNCLHLREGNPCGECEICRGVETGSLLDIVEIDAASNNGVDNIRELREEAVFTPAVAKYRVYIIDEVHMLSTSAFNALLKILEEPPEHVIFILATTEIHKVLPTIVSRCQRFDFQRIESAVIADRLLEVARRESFLLSDDAAGLIARLSDGGMRDALSLLDVCVANDNHVTLETVVKAAGLVSNAHLLALTDCILTGDTPGMLQTLAKLRQKSMEPQRLCEQLCGHYRNLMLVKTVDRPEGLLDCLPSEVEALRAQVKNVSLNDLLHSMTVLQDTAARMAKSLMKQAELELALVTLCEPSAKTGQRALLARIEKLETAIMKGAYSPTAQGETSLVDTPSAALPERKPDIKSAVPLTVQTDIAAPIPRDVPKDSPPMTKRAATEQVVTSAGACGEYVQWPQVLDRLAKINISNYAMLRYTKAYFNGKQVLIDVTNPIVLEMLRDNEYTKNNIKQAIFEATGEKYGLGPYRPPQQTQPSEDPLQKLIESFGDAPNITIE